jgi:hypothetical protein
MSLFRKCLFLSAPLMLCLTLTPAVHADVIATALNVSTPDGIAIGALVYTDLLGIQQWAYTNVDTDILNTRTTEFTAAFADVLGLETLTVTNTCIQVTVLGPSIPCQQLAFAFEDLSLGDANRWRYCRSAIGASIGSNGATFDYNPPPPPPPAVGPTPEPESLTLTASGLLGIVGLVRRKMRPSA